MKREFKRNLLLKKRRILIEIITWASTSSTPSSKALVATLLINVTMLRNHIRHLLPAPSLLYMFPSPGTSQVWIDQHFCHLLNPTGLQPSFTLVIYFVMAQNEMALEGWSKKWQGGLGKLDPWYALSWWAKIGQLIFFQILVCTWWYWVRRGQHL